MDEYQTKFNKLIQVNSELVETQIKEDSAIDNLKNTQEKIDQLTE